MTDRIVPSSTTAAPYYDDYDEDKRFYRVLFRPGYAVQARELTQLQTILQKQVQRFGDHVFKNGSMVTGGEITYQAAQEAITYLNLQSTFANTAITANSFIGNTIEIANTVTGNARGYVLAAAELNSTEPDTLIIKLTNGKPINPGDTVRTISSTPIYASLATANCSGNSSVISINEGVYFYNGYFAKVLPQTLILDKYDNVPTYRVGLEFNDSIVSSDDDTSLLDPAQEASNYQAPGATRYKIDLTLAKRTEVSTDDTKFVNLYTIDNGEIIDKVSYPIYSELEKTLARRTFDESGSYTVRPFIGSLVDHQPQRLTGNIAATAGGTTVTGLGTKFLDEISANSTILVGNQTVYVASIGSNLSLTTANTITNTVLSGTLSSVINPNKFSFKLSPGKAYVKGFEYETVSPTTIGINRARTYANVSAYSLYSPLGSYFFVTSANGVPDISTAEKYDIHIANTTSVNVTDTNNYANTKIGDLRIRSFEYSSAGASGNAKTYIYKAYVTAVNVSNATYSLKDAKSLIVLNSTTANAYNQFLTIDASSKANGNIAGNTVLQESDYGALIYSFPQQYVVPGTISGVSYNLRRYSGNVAFTSGVATLTLSAPEIFYGSGTLSDSDKLGNFIVTVTDKKSTSYSNGDIIPMLTANGRSISVSGGGATATLTEGSNTFTGEVIYTVNLTGTAPSPRTKTLITANTTVIPTVANSYIANSNTAVFTSNGVILVTNANNVIRSIGTKQNLYLSDVISISKVYDFGSNNFTTANITATSTSDITSNFYLDNGQRDGYYDHAAIMLRPGYPAPTGPVAIFVNYYTHAGTSGYLTVDSYPGVTTNAGYANVATYTSPSTGQLYYLRDCVDWRPKRANGVEAFSLVDSDSGSNFYIQRPGFNFTCNFSYYLSRVDKIVLTKDRVFKVISGVPDLYPQTPVHDENDMLIYTLKIPAYTQNVVDVDVRFNENKRYTMRDIGKLEKRIENLEYYASLNLLEKDADSLTITDSTGLNRFKNGIIVDSFNGHKVGDVQSTDYICAMDFEKGELWPSFTSNNVGFIVNSGASTNIKNNQGIITLDYDEVSFVTQDASTGTVAVNDYGYAAFISALQMYPDNDTWYDTNTRPLVLVNVEGENDAYEAMGNNTGDTRPPGFGTRYNDWSAGWAGLPVSTVNAGSNQYYPGFELIDQGVSRTTDSTTTKSARSLPTPSNSPEGIKDVSGDTSVDYSVVPYVQAKDVIVRGADVIPSSVFYPYFDNKFIQAFWINPTLITLSNQSDDFDSLTFETITASSGGSATVLFTPRTTSTLANTPSNVMSVVFATGNIYPGATITGSSSGATATVVAMRKFSDNVSSVNANTYKLNLANTLSNPANTMFNNTIVTIVRGTGAGQIRTITSFDNVANVAVISKPWSTTPDTTSVYNLCPPVSNKFGFIGGVVAIPANTFVTGEKTMRLTTSFTNSVEGTASYADGKYFATGRVAGAGRPALKVPDSGGSVPTTPVPTAAPEVRSAPAPDTGGMDYSVGWFPLEGGTGGADGDGGSPGGGGGGDGGDGCFTENALILMADGTTKHIRDIKIGERIMAKNKSDSNEVKLVEIVPQTFWKYLYSPVDNIEPFATNNHPLYIDGKLSVPDAEANKIMYPWLGDREEFIATNTGSVGTKPVYNLLVDGDGTYIVNGFGTTSIIGSGGWLTNCVNQGLIDYDTARRILNGISAGKAGPKDGIHVRHGIYILNTWTGKMDIKWFNKFVARMVVGSGTSNDNPKLGKPISVVAYVVGFVANLVTKYNRVK